ncbi:MAG: caspase family protein [Cyanobacteria bacterium P01_E01_bin.42]
MARNWAVCIGINEYSYLTSLRYATKDAEVMSDWLKGKAKFEKVYLFTDDSPAIDDMSQPFPSQPTYTTLRTWVGRRFKQQEKPPLSFGDNLWFFFSGHGKRYRDRDYLLLSDSNSNAEHIEQTAISLDYITKYLCQSGAGNIILFIDACRESAKDGSGLELTHQQGIISIASCSPNELSYEIEELQNGSFTHALLESLEIHGEGNCATIERLSHRLRTRVKEINRQYQKPTQTPHEVIQPASKYHFILLPDRATLRDVETLKMDAYKAEKEDARLAEKLWTQVLVASPADLDALASLKEIWLNKLKWEQQFKIEALEKSFDQERRSLQDAKAAEIQELKQLHQTQQEELERSLRSEIGQLEQQLEEERSQLLALLEQQSSNEADIKVAQEKIVEKESVISELQKQIIFLMNLMKIADLKELRINFKQTKKYFLDTQEKEYLTKDSNPRVKLRATATIQAKILQEIKYILTSDISLQNQMEEALHQGIAYYLRHISSERFYMRFSNYNINLGEKECVERELTVFLTHSVEHIFQVKIIHIALTIAETEITKLFKNLQSRIDCFEVEVEFHQGGETITYFGDFQVINVDENSWTKFYAKCHRSSADEIIEEIKKMIKTIIKSYCKKLDFSDLAYAHFSQLNRLENAFNNLANPPTKDEKGNPLPLPPDSILSQYGLIIRIANITRGRIHSSLPTGGWEDMMI